jgi:hypothetical protein
MDCGYYSSFALCLCLPTHDSAYEERIVIELCEGGGAAARPSKVALKDFSSKCQSLDMDLVCSILESRLADASSWQIKLVRNSLSFFSFCYLLTNETELVFLIC